MMDWVPERLSECRVVLRASRVFREVPRKARDVRICEAAIPVEELIHVIVGCLSIGPDFQGMCAAGPSEVVHELESVLAW